LEEEAIQLERYTVIGVKPRLTAKAQKARAIINKWKRVEMKTVRTLVRVVEVGDSICKIVLPAQGSSSKPIPLYRDKVPPNIWDLFEVDKRLHAQVNVECLDPDSGYLHVVFSNWEKE